MKKILIALDYDPTAERVAEAGFSLAKAMGAQVILLHVISEPAYYSSTAYNPIMGFGGYMDLDQLEPDIDEGLKKASLYFLDKSKQHLGDETIDTQVREGDVPRAILAAAKDLSADIIVMGSHSRRWLENIVMGSITAKVLHHTNVPVFIIPTKKQD